MPTVGYDARKALIKVGDGATPTEVFTTIGQVNSEIPMPQLSATTQDITSRDAAGDYDEVMPGRKSAGDIAITVIWDPQNPTHVGASSLLALFNNKTLRNFQITLPAPLTQKWSFAAYVVNYQPSAPMEGAMTASVTLRIVGEPTFA